MNLLLAEFCKLVAKGYKLDFTIPTAEELLKMRTLYRDITSDDRKKVADLRKALEKLPSNEEEANAVLQALPKELRERILRNLTQLED